jgi:hypothetical protein
MSEMQIYIVEAMVAGFVSIIVWAIRLEGIAKRSRDDITELKDAHRALDNKVVDKLSEVEKSLARIERRLGTSNPNG